jgi:hypothetical protein
LLAGAATGAAEAFTLLSLSLAGPRREEVEAALQGADVFFSSLIFDFDQVRPHSWGWGWGWG